MIQYFQLTPEILLEYIYEDDKKLTDEDGVKGNKLDICDYDNNTILLKSNPFSTYYMCFTNKYLDSERKIERWDSLSNLVLPLNDTETQFVIAKSSFSQKFYEKSNLSNWFSSKKFSGNMYEDTNYDKEIKSASDASGSCDVKYDKCVIHFTSRNYFGNYDSLIFQAYVYLKNKGKLYLSSFLLKRTADFELKSENLLYNEKLYTTHITFEIPSILSIFNKENEDFNKILLENNDIELLDNTPIGINVYGVTGNLPDSPDNFIRLRTRKINSIHIPYVWNRLDEISVKINEAEDGDYYIIDPQINGYPSFIKYIERMGEDIRSYMIMHEVRLKETWVDNAGELVTNFTHKVHHIIDINEEDEYLEISKKFDAKIKYRPICIGGGKDYRATIIDTIKIINTVDGSSYEVIGECDIINPSKYGKKIKQLNIESGVRPIVNVYNKKISNGRNGSGTADGNGSGTIGGNGSSNQTTGKLYGRITGNGTVTGGNSSINSINGKVSGNIPGLGFINGSINGTNINGTVSGSNVTINGDMEVSISANSVGVGSSGSGTSSDGGLIVINKGGGFMIENNSQNITSFIECTNVGVSIMEISPDDIN